MIDLVIYGSFFLEGDRFEGMNLDIVTMNTLNQVDQKRSTSVSGRELVGIFLRALLADSKSAFLYSQNFLRGALALFWGDMSNETNMVLWSQPSSGGPTSQDRSFGLSVR